MPVQALPGLLLNTMKSDYSYKNRWMSPLAMGSTIIVGLSLIIPNRVALAEKFELQTATIADIHKAIDAGALSSEKLTRLYLNRIEAYDKKGPMINSVICFNPHALDEARAMDEERRQKGVRGPLHGIPIVIKDLIDYVGLPTTGGFAPLAENYPIRDAFIVEKLKAAGAVVIAKVNTSDWWGIAGQGASTYGGQTRNPYNLEHSPGGSSGGTGASIASTFAAVGIGTDTGGSVQIPSSECSLVGIVATQGLVSRSGVIPNSITQDRVGPMTRNVYDAAVLLTVLTGWDPEDQMTMRGLGHFPESCYSESLDSDALVGKRIGVLRDMIHEGEDHLDGLAIFSQAMDDLRSAGAHVIDPIHTAMDLKVYSTSTHARVAEYEKLPAQNAWFKRLGPDAIYKSVQDMRDKLGIEIFKSRIRENLSMPLPPDSPDYLSRVKAQTAIRNLLIETMDRFELDAIAIPFKTIGAPKAGATTRHPESQNALTSNTGLPAVITPGGYTRDNLPIAIQFIGRPFDDRNLINIAYGFEVASKNRKSPESTPALPGEVFEY
jgi:Asp-tRNA(Asn)/Glu-tRNA(Gln) amidotransferase A subunit family amidase